ncbi:MULTISPECIES: 1,4-beta-xylanase [unclassified Lentimonas]|uniref:1,4-beta-xylanase n=1 Tax=unclassified Lentimonas TaxID=2630993 RepID=UPI00132CB76E|nr:MULTISPECIES: 1,4-beta-xylanase [unclassified Lentimonas]CAA6689453.1 Beta-galactosidase (EC [Lentimonas sp. CC10]CAA6696434.1 Beta-galactosidase (EC [Lentimonas sp. CC19]CAA7070517.1 Beta-galactosidase (EC [Lentimonas sp. CC11]
MANTQNATLGAVSAGAHKSSHDIEIEAVEIAGRWSLEHAQAWYASQPWLIGCNYLPATAINQLEMWQAETYDPATIDKELGWAENIGFNTLRVYLHDLVWAHDTNGLYDRMDHFLSICQHHNIRVIFVFFDDCHRPFPEIGTQPAPVHSYHNSGWMNSPARDVAMAYNEGTLPAADCARLKGYVQDTIQHFSQDPRVLMWELYNEPGREFELAAQKEGDWFGDQSAKLLLHAWQWARAAAPSQPICSTAEGSVGERNIALAQMNSDIQSFHCYAGPDELERLCTQYTESGRPALCTEYMARPNSLFQQDLPVLKKHNIGAINWGFVSGKSATIWPWSSKDGKDIRRPWEVHPVLAEGEPLPEPKQWFHDIFRSDGTAFDDAEVAFIKQMTGK